MSEKITGKELEKLLEGVLKEKGVPQQGIRFANKDLEDAGVDTAKVAQNTLELGLSLIAGQEKEFNEIDMNDLKKL